MQPSWTRPQRKLPPTDPEADRKRMQAIAEAVAKAGPDASVFVEDETRIKRFPPLPRQWQPVGGRRPAYVPEENDERTLDRTFDLTSGQTFVEAYEKGRSDCATQYLEPLLGQTEGQILLAWDQAAWRTSGNVTEWISKRDRIETYLLPVRSPETNPMEDRWRALKEQVSACLKRSLGALLESCHRYFEVLPQKQTLQAAGVCLS